MTPTLSQRIERLFWALTPTLMTLLLLLVVAVPLGLPHFSSIAPLVSVMSVYYWSIFRPEVMPAPAAFLIGLAEDVLSGGPIGLMSLVLLLVQGFCVSQRRVLLSRPFLVGWWGFSFVAAGASLATWVMACLYYLAWFDPRTAAAQFLLTVTLYPLATWLFSRTEARLLRQA
ncbi:MAG TPA: rod shape-determining protein MreD [Stellaceae bacterium]|nr:rod shape-determining protein MreD [Stellaceae bacterium]